MAGLVAAVERATAAAQELQLGRPEAPALGEASVFHERALQLDEEIELLSDGARGETDQLLAALLEARADVRMITRTLLLLAAGSEAEGSVAGVAGLTLANGLDSIDRLLSPQTWPADFTPADSSAPGAFSRADRFSDAYWSIARFNEGAEKATALLADPAPHALDAACRELLAPLRDALEGLEDRLAVSHWLEWNEPLPPTTHSSESPSTVNDPGLPERLAAAEIPEETRAILMQINALLDDAAQFPEFQRQAAAYRRHIEDAAAFAEELAKAEWAPRAVRDRALARLHASVVLFENKDTRSAGEAQLARLTETRQFLAHLNQLASLPRHRLRPVALLDAFLETQDGIGDPARAPGAREQLVRLNGILDRMLAWRQMRQPQMRRELKIVSAHLDRMYEQAEDRLLGALASLDGRVDIGGDPNLLAMLSNHAQIIRDLEHVQAIPQWTESIRSLRPSATERFEAQARRIANELVDPAARTAAVAPMNELGLCMRMFFPLPFEDELRAGSVEAASLTAGQQQAVLAQLEQARLAWIDARAEDEEEEQSLAHLRLLHRLLSAMRDCSAFAGHDAGAAELLNRWSAWEMNGELAARSLVELSNRLRLASQAAATGNFEELEGQLSTIDADVPLALLIVRLFARAGSQLVELPEGALSAVEEVAAPSHFSAGWLFEQRANLAAICRYAAEAAWAREQGNAEGADACEQYVNSLARDLVYELEAIR